MSELNHKKLDNIYHLLHEGISTAVSFSNNLQTVYDDEENSVISSLESLKEKLKQLNYFDSFAFYLIKDQIDFKLSLCHPENKSALIESDVNRHIDNGTFAWALNNNRPIIVSGPVTKNNQMLYSLATKRCIHGMFIANAKKNENINGMMLDIVQLILSIAVFSLDNNQLTSQIKDHNLHLEEKIQLRTKELERAKLRAEQSSRTRSEFLANMSHEIRTPMNGVLGMMELLETTKLTEQQVNYVNMAQRSGQNMLVILNEILDLSKYESGKLVIEEEAFNIIDVIDDVVALFSYELQEKGVELYVKIDPAIPDVVYGGKTRFWQIVMNLLGNAKKFTASGFIKLVLTLSNEEDSGELVLDVSVKDSGIGIAPEAQEKIFNPYEQASVDTTRQYGGTGLGLALCKRLIKMMGGDIQLHSVLGEGSDFYFKIKFKRVVEAKKAFVLNQEKNVETDIFFITDEPENCAVAESVFMRLDVHYQIFSSLEQMLSHFDSSDIQRRKNNILFVDDKMPIKLPVLQEKLSQVEAALIKIVVICNEAEKKNVIDVFDTISKPLQTKPTYLYLRSLVEHENSPFEKITSFEDITANVLLVEDNEVNQMVATGILRNIGCNVQLANNGKMALNILKEGSFDMILMDINMPEMGGCEATQYFRNSEVADKYTPIIAMTANVMNEDIEEYYDAGMDDYLAKPYTTDKLRKILIKWLENKDTIQSQKNIQRAEKKLTEHFDNDVLSNLEALMGDDFNKLVFTFLDRSTELLDSIPVSADDYEQLRGIVHSLKGSSGSMGANKLFSICATFETQLRNGNYDFIDSEVDKVKEEYKIVEQYFQSRFV